MLTYFPAIQPYTTHQLAVDTPHQIYVEECGNPQGLPILFVHGGPGAGCTENSRRFFDPAIYRIILFDQRGCGRSLPHAQLSDNTTQALIRDMEMIRTTLGVKRWILFGGSWGTTLSLLYAQAHPHCVMGMILRGVFLNRQQDIDWLYNGKGANYLFPDYWQDFLMPLQENTEENLLTSYYQLLTSPNELLRMNAAKAWATWEDRIATLLPAEASYLTTLHTALSVAQLECHYFINNSFIATNQILDNMSLVQNIPSIIIQGRYDIVCPMDNAWQLHMAWPNSELHIVADSGHHSTEPGIVNALIHATKKFAYEFRHY